MTFSNQPLKILMVGWEWRPHNSGGLGVACEGLVKGITNNGAEIIFILPKKLDYHLSPFCKFLFVNENLKTKKNNFSLSVYPRLNLLTTIKNNPDQFYSFNFLEEVNQYANSILKIVDSENFDLIHCHDWLTYPAAIEIKKKFHKPLIVHIHATEFDRGGGLSINPQIYEIEKQGFENADVIIAISNFIKNKITQYYGIKSEKIKIVHNAVEHKDYLKLNDQDVFNLRASGKKVVLFAGRITIQKGLDYFIRSAKKVLEKNPNVVFIVVGSGDMEAQMIEEVAHLGISDKVLFTGFLRGSDLIKMYQAADLYVFPSVSEPFGLMPLEVLVTETPVLISKQSGVSEILSHCLKVDFWDINEMANKILAVLEYPELQESLRKNGHQEVKKFTWQEAGTKCLKIYQELLGLSIS